MTRHGALERRSPGAYAEVPTEIPRRGWWQIARRAWSESQSDQVPLIAAGVAFYSFLSLFPAVVSALLLYGLIRDPAEARAQAADLTRTLPSDAASLITGQFEQLARTSNRSLGFGLVLALVLALWSAAGCVSNLVTALNIAYDEEETRGFVRRKLLALGLTVGAIVFAATTLLLVAAAPPVLDDLVGSGPARWGVEVARWVVLLVAMTVALAVLYRVAPDRENARFSWVSVGAVTATLAWLLGSLGFSVYVDNFGSYAKTYGALAGVAVLLLWLWMTMFLVLLGAELNAEAEAQTITDTTTGEPRPLGQRGAVKADSAPGHARPAR